MAFRKCCAPCAQQIAAGADVIKMYGSTGTDDDVTGFRPTPRGNESRGRHRPPVRQESCHPSYGPDGARTPFAPAPIR